MKPAGLVAATAMLSLMGVALAGSGGPAFADRGSAPPAADQLLGGSTSAYVVVLRQAPAASYRGGLSGYPATLPRPGERFDDGRAAVQSYRGLLLARQARLLASIGDPTPLYSYTTALDGFAVRLTPAQAVAMQGNRQVLVVEPDRLLKVDDAASTPASRAGLLRAMGTSRQAAGVPRGGRGVVIGVIDSGVGPDNPSLAGIPVNRATIARRYPGFTGRCEPGERWTVQTCTTKVIAAQYFDRGFGSAGISVADWRSARDGSGHGTSVAAIAAGNAGVATSIAGAGFRTISGAAPSAALSIYKACWTAPEPSHDGCDLADTVKAVDQAVRDGVDVINYSIAGVRSTLDDAVELAFRNAAAANVFVATSAGNQGPAAGSVQHPSPWVTTVGANTSTVLEGALRLGNGRTFVGAMVSDRTVGPARLVYAGDVPAAGAPPHRSALCYASSLRASD